MTIGSGTGDKVTPFVSILSERITEKYLEWLAQEFLPLTLATPAATQRQIIENSIRYWNTHSAFRVVDMFDYDSGAKYLELNTVFKSVIDVLPAVKSTWIWSDHPLWTLLGITVIDNVSSDLIMLSESFRNYRVYVGADMRWQHERSNDPDVASKLYLTNVPSGVDALCIVGTKRIIKDEDIVNEHILDWILRYAKALLKQVEGNTLRKSSIIGVKNDGNELVIEGKDEMKELQIELAKTGRWTAFPKRG